MRGSAIAAMFLEFSKVFMKAEKPTDPELFAVMERSVKEDKTVCEAKAALCEAKEEALCRLCAQDDGYISARMRYEEAVSKAYAEAQK